MASRGHSPKRLTLGPGTDEQLTTDLKVPQGRGPWRPWRALLNPFLPICAVRGVWQGCRKRRVEVAAPQLEPWAGHLHGVDPCPQRLGPEQRKQTLPGLSGHTRVNWRV